MIETMVAGGQQALEPTNETMYYDYYPPDYQQYPGQGSPDLCPPLYDYGPVTVPMVSTNSSPPIAMPVQVPHGHVVQQIVDESGTLRHVILSPQHPPIVPMPTHFGPGPATGSNQPPQPFFTAQGIPPGYPPYGPLQPGMLGPLPPQQGHSPPPNFHKDERTQRQYIKLKKKLEQKQLGMQLGDQRTPPVSPRKEYLNGIRVGGKKGGMSSVGTSEDGEESSSVQDEDEEMALISDLLSTIKAPQVTELSCRSALLQWRPPDCKSTPELEVTEDSVSYEVLLSDKGKEGKYKSIYSGPALSCRIQDLKPGVEYSVCVTGWLEGVAGSASEPSLFRTPACEPDTPAVPKLISRNRTALQLRWAAAADNGAPITHYVLESWQETSNSWTEVYRGKGKQSNLSKLQPASTYTFRLSAVNECGQSEWSDEVLFCTSDSPPPVPSAPVLREAGVNFLSLGWERRPVDEEFTLQMDDRDTGHGFLPVYNGKELGHVCTDLRRHTNYKFRLRAQNEEGSSQWSEEVSYRTLPGRPAPPTRPYVKGRVHAHSFKVKWEPPNDRGGTDITSYSVQLKKNGEFVAVYAGPDTECVVDRLSPGTAYEVRVCCESAGGTSDYSDSLVVATEATCPGQCAPPRLHGKPRPYSVSLKWNYPEVDGGAPVSECEIMVRTPNVEDRIAYRGKDTECTVTSLSPGHSYAFLLRANNRVGAGAWSEPLEVCSGNAPPDAPGAPTCVARSGGVVACSWDEPRANGAPITDYRLEMGHGATPTFTPVYNGTHTTCDVRNIPPASLCLFRLQACNMAGWSEFSPLTTLVSPPGVPGAPAAPRYTATPHSLNLSWSAPPDHGAPVTHYLVEVADRTVETEELSCTVDGLAPATTYKVKLKAVNSIGPGPSSAALKANTLPLPPSPPPLSCPAAGHNYLKLKWGDGKNPQFTQYTVQMENPRLAENSLQIVYQGTSHCCKVNRLQEKSVYRFCISAANDAGQGPDSSFYEFSTTIAPPPCLKAPRVSEVGTRSCSVEWSATKPMGSDPILYCLQLSRLRDQVYKQVYRGVETKASLGELEAGADYCVRVCAVRQVETGDLPGAYSPSTTFSTPALQTTPTHTAKAHHAQSPSSKPLSDTQWALILLVVFAVVSFLVAFIMQHFIY
ncbi:fibronectin type-III domain-containing protein 3a isoform X2 [Macrosteles quadrilineatus]|uniref:fibronectin type-III domain-containing protein 3a isoform X2 n=1 Tax=Macrosteles quadrilineatus TaxID=74068 RepID=UPI0023E179C2|nr:fibronectin type-III domain-containing protein 3a isoform X2 [Macrosteles quadrilineatus]